MPRFQYEDHVAALIDARVWPDSTRAISEMRLTIDYESASGWGRLFSRGKLSVDIVDYPGEWLLDLPLLGKDFRGFSADAFELAELPVRADISEEWRKAAAAVDPAAPFEEMTARRLAETFTAYLRACKADHRALSTLPPGRFLMPGDLDGSPALTFAPLPGLGEGRFPSGSLAATMERLPVTLGLSAYAMVFTLLIGIVSGIVAALRQNSWADQAAMMFAMLGISVPNFFLGLLMIILFAVHLGWLPSGGYVAFGEDPMGWLASTTMPAFSLAMLQAGLLARITRSSMICTLSASMKGNGALK